MGEEEAIQVARRHVEAFNAGDWGAYSADLTNETVHEEVATNRRMTGIVEILDLQKGWKAAFPDAKGSITDALACGSTAVLEITYEGTHSGNLEMPGGAVPPTGRRASVKAVEVVETENGKIKAEREYFDLAGMMAQLGLGARASA
jgi:steroid delta-isomerase-like uncharacterized protein